MEESLKLLNDIGYTFNDHLPNSRKLSTMSTDGKIQLLAIRPWDVTEYVEHGTADLGVVGYDVINEKQNNIHRLLDLKFGACSLVLAGPYKIDPSEIKQETIVATKFPNSTLAYFKKRQVKVKLVKLYGAIELAPKTGLSDIICDLTATGATLKENHLHIIDNVCDSTANLIASPISMKYKYQQIKEITHQLSQKI